MCATKKLVSSLQIVEFLDKAVGLVSPPAVIGESTVKGIAYYNIWYNFSVIKHMNFSNPD